MFILKLNNKFNSAPEISYLENLNQPLFVRMTGSGSVLVAYYQRKQDCELAKVKFKRKFRNYWCNASKTI